tara:strand:- start:1217 stop:1453 length:237 start_codon:yes stop_codon:yes gene_type:complete
MTPSFLALLAPVRALFTGTILLMAGISLLGVVLPLRMESSGYSIALTDMAMAAYYMGLAFGGPYAKLIILHIGHIRSF